jgi:putative phage-type endonuclease
MSGPEQVRSARGVGASEAAAAIGVSDYATPLDAWLVSTGRAKGFEGNEATEWGHILEPVIRAKYVERHGVTVWVPPSSLFHGAHAFIRATPDGIVVDDAGAWLWVGPQVKNVGLRMAPAWEEGGIPTDYLIQGVVEIAVTDLPRIDFAVLVGGQHYREATLERDPELEADVLEQLVAFWHCVETDTQPAIDHSKKFRTHALARIKRALAVEASPAARADIERWREVAVQIKALKLEEATLKNRIVAELAAANANKLLSPLGTISVGSPVRKTAWKQVAEDMRPLVTTLQLLDRDLAGLADLPMAARAERLEDIRRRLQLAANLNGYAESVARHTTTNDPRVTRPRDWTKGMPDLGEED